MRSKRRPATGWNHEVLGLKGNLNLTAGSPYDLAFSGMDGQGNIHIQTPIDLLAHEWTHGADYLLAKQAGFVPGLEGTGLMTDWVHVHGKHAHGELSESWHALEQGVQSHDHPVNAAGRDQGLLANANYLNSSREKIAYSFESMLRAKLGDEALLSRSSDLIAAGNDEVQAMWGQTFSSLDAWWQTLPEAPAPKAPAPIADPSPEADIQVVASSAPLQEAAMVVTLPSKSDWRKNREARLQQEAIAGPAVSTAGVRALGL